MAFRKEKLSSLLTELISEYMKTRVQSPSSAITITRLEISDDFKKVVIFVTMYPEDTQRETMRILKKERVKLRKTVGKSLTTKFIPSFEFRIDEGEKSRQRIEELIKEWKKNNA